MSVWIDPPLGIGSRGPKTFAEAMTDRVDERAIRVAGEELLKTVDVDRCVDRCHKLEKMCVLAKSLSNDGVRQFGRRGWWNRGSVECPVDSTRRNVIVRVPEIITKELRMQPET